MTLETIGCSELGALRLDVTTAEYLADPAPGPSLSSSIAKLLLDRSPAHARLAHPRLGGASSPSTAATDLGTLIHRYVLGKGAEIEPIDADDFRTKAAREARDRARGQGRIPVLARVAGVAVAAAACIRRELGRVGIELDGESEVAILWKEQPIMTPLAAQADVDPALFATAAAITGMAPYWTNPGAIWARAMLDHVIERDGMLCVYDLKSIHCAHPDDCVRSAINYGYDIQQEAYTRAAERLWPEYAGRIEFRFLFVETDPPYAVTVAKLDATMRERGRRRWAEAVDTWSRCLHTDTWPGYAQEPVTLWSPGWLLQRESEAAEARGEALTIYDE
jgi:hypothetical protein